jgi:hypothetical protein
MTFKKITEKKLNTMTCKWYGSGKQLKINDEICSGFTINYTNLNGIHPSDFNSNEISLSLKMFVKKDNVLYELYKLKLK